MNKVVHSLNYKIVADQAYTEDNILIYNIFTENIPKDATKQDIFNYFEQFGKVLDVRMIEKNDGRKCFIDFEDSKVAAKVLKQTNHFMNKKLKLKACLSYHQPDGLKIIAQLKENYEDDSITEEAAAPKSWCYNTTIKPEQNALILNLNDDCLEHICKQLPPKDQINFALTCQRFCHTFKMISSVEYLTLSTDTFTNWTPWQARIFLQLVGPQIKTLKLNSNVYDGHGWKMTTYIQFLSLNLEKLSVSYNFYVTDDMIRYLERFKNLKSLQIFNCDITGKNINLLTGLKELSLIGCNNLSSCHFKRICQCLRNLQYLGLTNTQKFVTDDFRQISENLLELESLNLTVTEVNFNCLAQLPKLKHLELTNLCQSTLEEFFKLLAKHQAEQLMELKMLNMERLRFDVSTYLAKLKKLKILHCDNRAIDDKGLKKISQLKELEDICFEDCKGITDETALEVLKNCLKLKRLHLLGCNNINPEFIINCIKLLKEQKERGLRSDRVYIKLSDSGRLRAKLKTIPKEDYTDILNITFEFSLSLVIDDEVTDDEVTDDEVTDDEITDDEVTDDEVTDDEVTDDEVTDDEVADDEVTDEED